TARTSRADDWPVPLLRRHKRGRRVSVVLPALDEESTVGPIVTAIRRELVETTGLVDELVVVDSGSRDATAAVASAAGATVVHRADVLPQLGDYTGKGETLWKSLAATSGDIVVFCDADLTTFSPTYITGLLGPLLTAPDVHLVKGAFDRPLGRVTELVARPVLALHWPDLAGVVQPLAGEYAGRRR